MASRAERQAEAAHRRAEIVQARMAGTTFEEIGDQFGVSAQRAQQLYADAMRRTVKEPADQHRALELRRLDDLQLQVTEVLRREHITISGGKVVVDDDGRPYRDDGPVIAAARALLAIQERRAKLLGLDAPTKIEGRIMTVDQIDARIGELEALLAADDPDAAAGQRRQREGEEQLRRFRTAWSTPGAVARDPTGFVAESLDVCLQALDLDDGQREQAALEVERMLWNRADR